MPSQRPLTRIGVNIALDGALAAAAAPLARWIADPAGGLLHPLWFLAGGGITLILAGAPFRLPQQYWRFAGMSDLLGVVGGSIASAMLFALLLIATGFSLPSPTFPIIHALVLMALLATPRVVYRQYQKRQPLRRGGAGERVLLVGSVDSADAFLRVLGADPASRLAVVGLVSRAVYQTGRRIQGRPILGTVEALPELLARLERDGRGVEALVLTEPEFAGAALAQVIEQAAAAGLAVRRAPRPTALRAAERIELRAVAIEELLNRPQVSLDRDGMRRLVAGRRVLVTGAGGSIGAELARQIAALGPSRLVLLDSGEFALWQVDLELGESEPAVRREAVIADVRDATRIHAVFAAARPELVFHAAALKHVPIVEDNPLEGLLTNAVGTRNVADAAAAAGASAMVLISTDKAVNPTSMMGVSKRVAEMFCQALDIAARRAAIDIAARRAAPADRPWPPMRCVTVRFGNVLGSTGSVVPLFRRQLERGGPLTVTHPDMERYFMTVREAVSLVLQASVIGTGSADEAQAPGLSEGGIFVLDMGEPVKIVALARQMIRLAGLRPDEDVAIRYTGLRPGEKLYEELFHGREPPVPTGSPGLLMAAPRTVDPAAIRHALSDMEAACRAGELDAALALVSRLVPEYGQAQAAEESLDKAARDRVVNG